MWLLIATIGQIILGSSAVFDKLLITPGEYRGQGERRLRGVNAINPLAYAFGVGMLGLVAVIFLPFGFQSISVALIGISLVSGACFIIAMFFLYRTLRLSEVSEVFPLVGALSPIATLALTFALLGTAIRGGELFGFLFLVAAGFFVTWAEKREFRDDILIGACVASAFFALSYVLAKSVFLETNFVTGFFWTKMGGVILAVTALATPSGRKRILEGRGAIRRDNSLLYAANRAYASTGSVLVSYAVFLANPALVDATQNIKYIILLIVAKLITRERFHGAILAKKIAALACVIIGLSWLSAEEYIHTFPALRDDRPITWGVTFSTKFARQLDLDWRETFSAVIDDLKPKSIRLIAYWDEIEKKKGVYDFSDLDWQLQKARDSSPQIVLAVGMKVPRWPECHIPAWARDMAVVEREGALRAYMQIVIERYRNDPLVKMWQVENEPYLLFGQCPPREDGFLEKEIQRVKAVDPQRPVLTTDGGEFGLWYKAARAGDVFGTTMYRSVYPTYIGPLLGTVEYPLSPQYFRLKERSIRWANGDDTKPFIVIELQAEPWGEAEIQKLSYKEELRLFSPEYFRETIQYAKDAGFDEYYLWGVEWWYELKKDHNDLRMWKIGKELF